MTTSYFSIDRFDALDPLDADRLRSPKLPERVSLGLLIL